MRVGSIYHRNTVFPKVELTSELYCLIETEIIALARNYHKIIGPTDTKLILLPLPGERPELSPLKWVVVAYMCDSHTACRVSRSVSVRIECDGHGGNSPIGGVALYQRSRPLLRG